MFIGLLSGLLLATLLGVAFTAELHAQTTPFTYQGQLDDNGSPAGGVYALQRDGKLLIPAGLARDHPAGSRRRMEPVHPAGVDLRSPVSDLSFPHFTP